MLLVDNRVAFGKIYLSKEQNVFESPALFAAKELRYYFGRMSGGVVNFEEFEGNLPENSILLGECSGLDVSDLGEDGFKILVTDKCVKINGGKRGIIYGAYELLERLGCRFFTVTCEKIPTLPKLEIPEFETTQKPVLEYREHDYVDVTDPKNAKFIMKCRLNGSFNTIPKRMGGNNTYAWFVHTFEYLVPTSVYGKTHPEYFSMINGQRCTNPNGTTQLCLTNPDVLKISIESARKKLRECPDCKIISISQNDWYESCQCDNCRRVDQEEGSPSGTLLRFVNAVAEALEPEFPDVIFDTLAYLYSRPAPKITHNRKNVCVRLCSIECCFAHPFETCDDESRCVTHPNGTKTRFIDDLRAWGKICDRMYIWDYTTSFAHYPSPHPNWRALAPNIQAMVRNNVKGIFEEANRASKGGVDFNELRLYLLSKLLWDPYCDLEKHKTEFLDEYYGAAAPYMKAYLDFLCDVAEKENIHVGFNDDPVSKLFREELLDKYESFFDRGAKAVAGDPLRLYRVEKNRLSIRWIRLKRKTMLDGQYDVSEINKFFEDWRGFDLSRIDEWFNFENTLRALLEGRWRAIDYYAHWTGEEEEFL